MLVSVIIPAYNEAEALPATLASIAALSGSIEAIVVDGGSADSTVSIASAAGVRVVHAPRGRGAQMHAGALATHGDALWFMHADTLTPPQATDELVQALSDELVVGGNFALRFDGPSRGARQLTAIYPHLRKLGLSYGDAGIFVRRSAYQQSGGFAPYPIFEDLDMVRRLKRLGRFAHLNTELLTSSRRFEHRNFPLMFGYWSMLQLLYWAGVPPARLGSLYAPVRKSASPAP